MTWHFTRATTAEQIERRISSLLNDYKRLAGAHTNPLIEITLAMCRAIAAGEDVARCPGSDVQLDDPFDLACPSCRQQPGSRTDGNTQRWNEHLRPVYSDPANILVAITDDTRVA